MTTLLIIQNIYNRRNTIKYISPRISKDNTGGEGAGPKLSQENIAGKSKPLLTDTEGSNLDQAVKMVKNGISQKDILGSLDIEPDYLSVLVQNYKAKIN